MKPEHNQVGLAVVNGCGRTMNKWVSYHPAEVEEITILSTVIFFSVLSKVYSVLSKSD